MCHSPNLTLVSRERLCSRRWRSALQIATAVPSGAVSSRSSVITKWCQSVWRRTSPRSRSSSSIGPSFRSVIVFWASISFSLGWGFALSALRASSSCGVAGVLGSMRFSVADPTMPSTARCSAESHANDELRHSLRRSHELVAQPAERWLSMVNRESHSLCGRR